MASGDSSKDKEQFTCGICLEYFSIPRYLPTCGHTFCEHCLLTYASNLQRQGSKLECPVCRKPRDLSENIEVTLEWIQTFPLNNVIIKMMESLPKSSKETTEMRRDCDACKEGGEIIVAVKFCLDCKETMCETCANCHKRFKVSSDHKLIDIKELSNGASYVGLFDTLTKCPSHPEREVSFYCKSHNVVMCGACILINHGKPCIVVEVSSNDTDAAKLREEAEKLTSQMREVIDHINLLQKLRKQNQTNIKVKLKEIREMISQVRDQVVKYMDNVVSHVTNVTKQIEIEIEDKLDEEVTRVSKMKELTEGKLALMDTVERHGSERHKLISAHLMESEIEEIGKQISVEDRRLRNVDAELKLADAIRNVIESTTVEKLVQVTVNESESSHKHLDDILNYLRDHKLVRVEEHTIHPYAECTPSFYGIAMLKDGRVVLSSESCANHNDCGYMCLYNPANKTMMKLKLNKPHSATQIDDTHIAVSIPLDKTISIVTVGNELRVEKTIKTQNTPSSIIALNNGQLAVSWANPPAFSVNDISGTEIVQMLYLDQDSSGRKFRSFRDLAVDEKRHHVIQPCNQDKAVYCFDFTGQPVFKYTDPGYLGGVALDRCGNIYLGQIYSEDQKGIHKISPAGELISITKEGILGWPQALCTERDGTGVWVTQILGSNDKVLYFRLEQNPGP